MVYHRNDIAIVDDDFNLGGVHLLNEQLLRSSTLPLAQRAVDRLDNAFLAFAFGTGLVRVLTTGQDSGVSFPLGG